MITKVAPRNEHELIGDIADVLDIPKPESLEDRVISADYRTAVLKTALLRLKTPENRLHEAIDMAKEAHKGQTYAGEDYYSYHVLGVASNFRSGSDECIVAILHDAVEDSDLELEDVREKFGAVISGAVMLLTRPLDLTYDDYIRRIKLFKDSTEGRLAYAVKIADAEFNLAESIKIEDSRRINRYRKALDILMSEDKI